GLSICRCPRRLHEVGHTPGTRLPLYGAWPCLGCKSFEVEGGAVEGPSSGDRPFADLLPRSTAFGMARLAGRRLPTRGCVRTCGSSNLRGERWHRRVRFTPVSESSACPAHAVPE